MCGCSIKNECTIMTNDNQGFDQANDENLNTQWMSTSKYGYRWIGYRCSNVTKFIGGIVEGRSAYHLRSKSFEIVVSNTTLGPLSTGDNICYKSTTINPLTSPYWDEQFSCTSTGGSIYMFRRDFNEYFEIAEIKFYKQGLPGQVLVDGNCVCPSGASIQNGVCTCSVVGQTVVNGSICACPSAQQSVVANKCSCGTGKILSGGSCVSCPIGTYFSNDFCVSCPQNKTTIGIGSIDISSCVLITTKIQFTFTGSLVQWRVPPDVYKINMKMWGAGGGGSCINGAYTVVRGGPGGFSSGTVSVTPGSYVYIAVGGGGSGPLQNVIQSGGWPSGGGGCYTLNKFAGMGGGRSQISIFNTEQPKNLSTITNRDNVVMIAGSGGGSAVFFNGFAEPNLDMVNGKSGGGLVGGRALDAQLNTPGGQTEPGGCTYPYDAQQGCWERIHGKYFWGGVCNTYNGGGGDGWVGGSSGLVYGASRKFGGGAGGSGYLHTSVQKGFTALGSHATSEPFDVQDPDNNYLYGIGGVSRVDSTVGGSLTKGNDGVVYISYGECFAGYYSLNGICNACPKGTYSTDGGSECQNCPAERTTVSTAAISAANCSVVFCNAGSFGPLCTACSPSKYCPPGSTVETPCQAGSYCATPSTQVQCPQNTYCPASSTAPTDCPSNHVSQPGSTMSTQCETAVITVDFAVDGASVNLTQSQFQQALPDSVQLNSYEDVLVLSAGVCPQGYYCPPDTTTAIPCPARTYNNNTNGVSVDDCLTCPVGQYCPLASILPTSCDAGSYRITEGAAQQSECTVCPSGNYCPVKSVTPTNCSAGTYGPDTAATSSLDCQVCPAGEYCPIATTTPVACAAGSYRGATGGAQQSDCDTCPAGQFCPIRSITPADCAAGSYRGTVGGTQQGDCTTCPSGNFCPIKSVDPTNCSVSTYNPASGGPSADSCLACPEGEYCPLATTTPISCAAGSYRGTTGAGAQSDCATCPTGNYCPIKSINPTNCSAGTYNPSEGQTSSAACLSCPAGDYCPTATTTPTECEANTFAAVTGKAVCDQCPVYSTSPIASTNCTCDAGHYHVVSSSGSAGAVSVNLQVKDSLYDGVVSGMGAYLQSGDSSHISVTQGSVVTITSQPFIDNGNPVPNTMKLYSNLYRAFSIPVFTYEINADWGGMQYTDLMPYPESKGSTQQVALVYTVGLTGSGSGTLVWDTANVPSNVYYVDSALPISSVPMSVFVASVTPTTITYRPSDAWSEMNPTSIAAGCVGDTLILYKPTHNAFYTAAPLKNVFVSCFSATDQSSSNAVTVMASGPSPLTWVIPATVDNSVQCYVSYGELFSTTAPGSFGAYSKITVYPRPSAIGAGESSLTCANCSSGYRSDPGAQVCTQCGLGYYSSPVSQTCTACPVGTKCPSATTPAPVNCGVGLYQSQSGQATCLPCPVGQYCDLDATVTPTDCPAGSFRSTEGAASLADCETCPAGNFCPIKSVNPTDCAAGSYRSSTGGQSQDDCSTCTVGNYCPVESVNPTNCAAGSYRSTTGAKAQSECDTCTTGHYCPIQSVNPTDCVAGTYNPSTGGQQESDCLSCPEGEFCIVATTTPTSCAAGSYRGEKGAKSQDECAICPTGNYCPIKSIDPTNCTAGTYNPESGSVSSAACLSCPVGDYCLVASTNPSFCDAGSYRGSVGATKQDDCTVCPSGNYCPTQSVNPINCSSGTFRATSAGAAVSDCIVCAIGKYSMAIASSTDCPLCPTNYYCTNSITIRTCPTHTSSAAGSSSLLHCRCDQGYKCAYSKRITAIVTLNSTTSSFNNDVGGIKTAFINAVASAAGVSSNQVTINNVVSKPTTGGGRRLLSIGESFIDVFATVQGAERLHKLDFHLARHSVTLHQGHSWQEAHSVSSSAIRRGSILST